jgi:pyruvate dehydrogenase (quinone)/pyruvate oxidase
MKRGQLFSISGTSCTMASGISYGIGAQVAFPNRQVVVLAGDGAVTMAMGDLLTLAQYKLPVKLLVFKNNSLALERWEQLSFMGNPEFGNDLLPADFVKIAEGCGIKGMRIDDPTHCYEQLREALAMNEPMLIECEVDPNEPALETPMPEEHAENYKKALKNSTYLKEEAEQGLREHLQHQKQTLPQSMNKKSEELLKELKKK